MNDLTVRKQRLRTLENQIRSNYEAFVATGFALKEIRDDRLYREDDFETWDAYLKERVGEQFGIEEAQARKLIVCAQIRPKLPDLIDRVRSINGEEQEAWSQRELLEFARLSPRKDDEPGQPFDMDKLDRRDVDRVAKKVIEHCQQEGEAITSTIVRKFVDADLGINRAAKAKETKQRREEESRPLLRDYLVDMTGRIEAETEHLTAIDKDAWKQLGKRSPNTVKRLTAACEALADLLRRTGG